MSRFPEFLRPIAFLVTLSVLSCSEEEVAGPLINDFEELTQRDHVVQNLEASYREGNIGQVGRVMDDSFSFCFTQDSTRCWLRGDELSITSEVMADDSRIDIQFSYAAGEQKWIANTTDPRYGEAIWEKLINYSISRDTPAGRTVETGRATFLIRRVRFEDANRWRLTGIFDHTGLWGALKAGFMPEG